MTCPRCGARSAPGTRFCGECGSAFHATCGECGAALASHQKFCAMCGRPVAGAGAAAESHPLAERLAGSLAGTQGERKQITVLFADLRGSLELLGDRDPEEARRLLDPVLVLMVEAVRRWSGTVNQVMGDGIMALFGAPIAQEDHAVRACHAALELHDAVARHAATVRPSLNVDLRLRIGLNSGDVVVRFVESDLRFEYTAVGRTTHVAARMEQLALPGTTLLTGTTRRLAEGYVDVRSVGPVTVRGLATPVDVYELLGTWRERPRFEAARVRWSTRFVGRDLELAALRRAAERAAGGRGQVVAVVGESGIGKSRLVGEFTRRQLPDGWLVLETGAIPHSPTSPYLPVVGLLRRHLDVREGEDAARIGDAVTARILTLHEAPTDMVPPILELLGVSVEDPAWRELDPARRRQRTLDAVTEFFVRHSLTQPVCVVVEDVQDLDAETQALLDRLVDRVASERMLLVVTYRPEYVHGWSGRGHYAQLPVQPLPPDEAERLLSELLGAEPELEGLVALLVERSDGNPLFLESSVSDLVEAQTLVGEPGSYRLKQPVAAVHVPSTVQAVLAARIDRLSEEDRSLLQWAAAIGKDIPVGLLAAVMGLEPEQARSRLDGLVARGFLYESGLAPAAQFSFAHVLVLEVALGGLVTETRRALDLRILDALERLHADRPGEQAERLAHHALRGEVWDRAVRYCREAGARALLRSAHGAAVEYFGRALAALGCLPQTGETIVQGIDVRLDLRTALIPLGEYRRTVDHLREAETLARSVGDERRLASVGSHLANYLHLTGQLTGAVEQARHALGIAERLGDVELQVVTTAYLAFAYYTLGSYREAADLARRNTVARAAPSEQERFGMTSLPPVYSRTCLAWSLAELGDFDEAERIGDEAIAIAERADHSYSVVYACLAAGVPRLRRGAFDAALVALERAFTLCHTREIPVLLSIVAVPLAAAYGHAGRVADAVRVLEETAERAQQIRDPIGHWVRTGALAEAYALAGRPVEAHPLALQYLAQRRTIGARGYEAWALHLLAEVTARLEPPAQQQASRHYEDAITLAGRLDMRPLAALCRLGLGRLDRRLGRTTEGEATIREAIEGFRSMGMRTWLERAEGELRAE
ncbi:MAG: AAA family ATPase [Candidatus Rokubacteria bacterium]|nr:AAA family ATPase [Candidatus Rokubacteria bacterium]